MPVCAQPRAAAAGGTPVSLSLFGSYSQSAEVEHGAVLGETSVSAFRLNLDTSTSLPTGQRLVYGLEYGTFALDRDAGVPLPDDLQALSLPLAVAGSLGSDWTGRLILRPGFASTSLEFSSDHFNVPVLALASYRANPDLSWTVGVRYDAWDRYEVLPLAGVNWRFAPDWELSMGLPRTGVSWRFRPDATLLLGASYQGGSFRVTEDPRPAGLAAPMLGNTKLDYREIRVGAAVEFFAESPLAVLLDVGAIVSQRFDYHERDYRIEGDTAAYAAVSGRLRF